jgi:DNA-binding transcriptional LysR family regulator
VVTGPLDGPGDPRRLGFAAAGLEPPTVALNCESFSTLLSLISGLDLIGIMPAPFFEQVGRHAGIVKLPIDDALPRVTLHAVWRADAPLAAPAQRLLEALEHESIEVRRAAR